jgi:hypothetical protein
MTEINVSELCQKMLAIAQSQANKSWPSIQSYAQTEFQSIAQRTAKIVQKKLQNEMSDEDARDLLDAQERNSRIILLSIEGQSEVMIEGILNSVLNVAKDTINTAIGYIIF